MQKNFIKISIITVCKNSAEFIEETIKSVASQTYPDIEYIVIDGNSTDGTAAIVDSYKSNISHFINEADNGMYDAINKGLALASGDYFLVLNSDDLLADSNTIAKVCDEISRDSKDWYYGNIIKLKNGMEKKVKLFPVTFKQLLLSTHGTFAQHPCFFISRKLNSQLGGYNFEFKYASDYDYILRAMRASGNDGRHVDIYITKFRMHDNSITASGKINKERFQILSKHGYYDYPFLSRKIFYYTLWIYYKIINLGHRFRRC